MTITYITFIVSISISIIAACYSISGLILIFSGAFWSVLIMGTALEVGKIVSTIWLHQYWSRCKIIMRVYLVFAIGVLMLITSLGIFGGLSRAHADQGVVSADKAAEINILDEKIKIERESIEYSRQAIAQMNAGVDQTIVRSTTENAVGRAVQIRKSQSKERSQLQKDIDQSQTRIKQLNDERAPLAAELRKFEAEVGPIKYIAAMVYNDNPDAATLERAVRWVIILLVVVFDPLAITLVLAANESLKWEKDNKVKKKLVESDIIEESAPDEFHHSDMDILPLEIVDSVEFTKQPIDVEDLLLEEVGIDITDDVQFLNIVDIGDIKNHGYSIREASKLWKNLNPDHTLKEQRNLLSAGQIDRLPWEEPEFLEKYFVKK